MKRSTKQLISVLICLAMAFAMLPVAAFAAATTRVYCQAPEGWTNCYIHYWGGAETSWPGVTMNQDENGIWYFEVPNEATGLLFHNNAGAQTTDLTPPADDHVMYVFANNYWTTYGKVEVFVEYFVAGVAGLCGVDWNPGAIENRMTENEDGTYSITYTGIAAGSYEMKVTNGTWVACWGEAGTTNNYVINVADNDSTVVISFDPATELVSVEINPVIAVEDTLISEGTATYATDADAWNADGATFTPAADGIVLVDITACTPGFYLDVYQDGEWIDEYYDTDPHKVEIPVVAGATYEFLISSAAVYSPTMYEMKAGSVTYKITANVAAGEPSQGGDTPGEGNDSSEENPQSIGSFYGNYIQAGQTMWFVFDNYDHMINDGVYSQMLHISAGVPYSVTYRGMDVPVDAEGFVVYEMVDMMYQGKYVFSVTNNSSTESYFTIEVKDRPAYVISDVALVLGDNVVLPDPEFSKTLYEFTPEEKGIYTFTISEGFIGNWGTFFNPFNNTGTKDTVLEWTCTDVGQSVLIGVAEAEEAVLTIAKTGEYVKPNQIPEIVYENTFNFEYQLPANAELVSIDVLDNKADVAVLDKDGFYRYGSKYGPLMVTDLNEFPINLADAYINGQLKAYISDADGQNITKYDYNEAMNAYLEAGLVPVTEELARMLKQLGDHHGWWNAYGFVFEENAPADAEAAWMVACSYIKGSELEAEEDDNGNQGGNQGGSQSGSQSGNKPGNNQGSNPKTADISMMWAMIAMVLAGTGLVILKKKENFFIN